MAAWTKGQSGNPNGRPKGPSTHQKAFMGVFWRNFYDDWKRNGAEVIEKVRTNDPTTYLKIAASVLPRVDPDAPVNHAHQIEVILKPPAWLTDISDNQETDGNQAIDITPQSNDDESSA